ncbi:annexin B9-like [Onthophagus taurus]|uniref:annexin B9-like n=1 Tax=Onthophagus taurus TaxID=166361 RepID=UPI000C20610A|nr:annexin B9-like [Onthophagus taurus]
MGKPTVTPCSPFDPVEDSKALKQAFKGFGSDEEAIINIIAKRTNDQRQQIAKEFKTMYGKDLIKELKSELRGNFEDVIIALMTNPVEFQAKQLHKSISGLGTDEDTIVEILGVHNNNEVIAIREVYEGLYQTSLEKDLKGDTSGTVKRLFVSLATGHRDESEATDKETAYKDAQTLLRAGELFHGTDESTFNAILCQRNRSQLRLIFDEYEKLTDHCFETAIDNEFSGTAKDTLMDLIKCIRDRIGYIAERLHKSMDRIGTDDRTLIRLVVSRSEIDLGDIKEVFEEKYGKSLADFIRDDTSGDYKKCLLEIVG